MTRIRTSFAPGLPLAIVLVLLLPAVGQGQTSAGKIIGVVQDSSGGVLPGVSIVIKNLGTGNSRETLTDDRGQFDVPGLAPGRYQIDAELQGFRKFSQGPVTVQVNQETRVNATLSVGSVQETLTVTAEGLLVQTSTSVVGKVVDEKQILQLPLSGRNFADLGLLTPGVTTRGQSTSAGTSTSSFYVHGQRNDANNFLLDGVSDNSLEGNVLQARPNVDAVQEFKIQTSNFSAEFGRNTGSVVNVVTKSGTNAFTGSGWEFVRSDKFQAKNFFATTEPPPLTFNQYGGTLGGPVVRNKTFFFGSFEGYREARGQTRQTIVATAQERAGNFSFLSKALIDPSTGLPFPGNLIPLNRIDPAAIRLLTLMPLPNIPGVAPRQNNYVSSPESQTNYDQYMIRGDHTLNGQWSLFYRHFLQDNDIFNPFQGSNSANYDGFPSTSVSRPQHGTGGVNAVFSSTILNEFRVGFSRLTSRSSNQPLLNPVDFGVNYVRPQDAVGGLGLPDIAINGISGIGNTVQGPGIGIYQEYEFSDVLTAVKGRHNMRIGGTYRPGSEDIDNGFFVNGRFVFNGTYTGDTLADFLLGKASEFDYGQGRTRMVMVNKNWGTFFQDDWKVRDNLTFNLGVRYDYFSPITDKLGQTSTFLIDQQPTGAPQSGKARVINAGTNGLPPNGTYFPDKKGFQPRGGFSWNVSGDGKLALRGGLGVFRNQLRNNLTLQQILSYPFYQQPVVRDTSLSSPIKPTTIPLVGQLYVIDPDVTTPYSVVYNINTQWQFMTNTILEVAYVGNRGYNLLQLGNELNQPIYVAGQTTQASKDLFRPFPGFTSVLRASNWGRSDYNGLETSVTRRFDKGLQFQASYVLSRSNDNSSAFHSGATNRTYLMMPQDANDKDAEYGSSEFDARHRVNLSEIFELPFGRDKRWLRSGPLAAVFGNWAASSIWTFQSGFPYSIYDGRDPCLRAGNWTPSCRPNVQGDPNDGPKTAAQWFNTAAFRAAPAGQSGNSPRNSVRGPGMINTDLSFIKRVPFGRSKAAEFRIEVFNMFNRVNLGVPVTDLSSSSFGRIQATATNARELQLGAKFRF
jgi:Carboxypeptidase regulatory-like domain/TonB-dependent Receptor Plug Domain